MKLAAALEAFGLAPAGWVCADLGCNVGGFTDCLLQRGASKVYAVDTGYGTLAWKLRTDARVVAMERTNALHAEPAKVEGFNGCDLVVVDLAWTRQRHAVPAALRWMGGRDGWIVTLIKPHYEADRATLQRGKAAVLDEADAAAVAERVAGELPGLGVKLMGMMVSPIRGGAGKGRVGNVEYLAALRRAEAPGVSGNAVE